jgi:hypothetical protein
MTDRELMQMAYQATPHEVLIAEIMDCGVPKNEREHAAAREIQALRDRLAQPEYDQAALELCDVCGWKAVVPDECCLNCKRLAQPEPWVKTYCGGKPNYTTQPEQNLEHSIEVRCFGSTVTFTTRELLSKYKNGDRFYRIPPPKREWVGLTEDEFEEVLAKYNEALPVVVCRAIEAKLKEKNT